jgi:SAM-dependent methyltransferase
MNRDAWEKLGSQSKPSWYLDPVTAKQKRDVHLELIGRWSARLAAERILKTDLFEEAFGEDRVLPGLFPGARIVAGIDISFSTAREAARRFSELAGRVAVSDVRRCGFGSGAFDLVLSTSTLDHFVCRDEFLQAVAELSRVLRPGGLLILTLDNPWNPLYAPLRWLSRITRFPFFLGYTPSMRTLKTDLRDAGFDVEEHDWLLHNPRLLSTILFLMTRKVFGKRADGGISALLEAFAFLGRLPTRRWTACFQAVAARKRE